MIFYRSIEFKTDSNIMISLRLSIRSKKLTVTNKPCTLSGLTLRENHFRSYLRLELKRIDLFLSPLFFAKFLLATAFIKKSTLHSTKFFI